LKKLFEECLAFLSVNTTFDFHLVVQR